MTAAEAYKLLDALRLRAYWAKSSQLGAEVVQRLREGGNAGLVGFVQEQMFETVPRQQCAQAVRVALASVCRDSDRLGYLPELHWDETRGLVAGRGRVSVADLFTAAAEALADEARPLAGLDELMARSSPDTDPEAIAQGLIAAAFASITLWGCLTRNMFDRGVRAAQLLARAGLGADVVRRCEEIETALASARIAGG